MSLFCAEPQPNAIRGGCGWKWFLCLWQHIT